ncbi:NADPH-dependent diflavin oxidoreductase 1 [Chamberlinius hualienensis]
MDEVRVTVLFGSQTGTAQDIAERIGRQAKYYHFRSLVMAMDDYPIGDLIEESLVVFVCSTTGQGEEPDNMKRFWKFLLRKHLPNDCLSRLKCAVLGLGDSSYTKFNFAAKKLSRRLQQLGAKESLSLGLADDQHDLGADAVVEVWIKDLWSRLFQLFPRKADLKIVNVVPVSEPKYRIEFVSLSQHENNVKLAVQAESDYGPQMPYFGKVLSNIKVTSGEHFQEVRLIKIDISDSNMSYEPGDITSVLPSNSKENIEEFFNIFNLDQLSKLVIKQSSPDMPLPSFNPGTSLLRDWVTSYFDIQSVPRRYFFELLKHFGGNDIEIEKLDEFLSSEGQRDLYNYCHSAKRSCLEVLRDFPHSTETISPQYLFDLFSPIKPRSFSIASESSSTVELLVAVVKYKTKLAKERLGLCSNWLTRLNVGDLVPMWLRKGTMKFIYEKDIPVIMIGPGTGCAPFRGFLLRRTKLNLGNNYLFFGCRNREGDFFFQDEWNEMQQCGLLHLFTAFSRDQEQKIYVQHLMLEVKQLLWKLIDEQGAYVYLAGNAKDMPKDVTETLLKIFQSEGRLSEDGADNYMKKLEMHRRFQTETWS